MDRKRFLVATAMTMSVALSAVAQHGHGAMGSSMHGMGHQPSSHSAANTDAKSGTHGERTMDQKLTSNTKLAGKIQDLTGMDAKTACTGFKNLGQCVAAAHVSKNLGISFTDLKDDMLALNADGTANTSAKPMSLGKAIETLKPGTDSSTEVKKANQQAKEDTSSAS